MVINVAGLKHQKLQIQQQGNQFVAHNLGSNASKVTAAMIQNATNEINLTTQVGTLKATVVDTSAIQESGFYGVIDPVDADVSSKLSGITELEIFDA